MGLPPFLLSRGLLRRSPEHYVGEAFTGLLVRFRDDMAVDIRRGTGLGMTQSLGNGNDILSAVDQDRRHGMPIRYNKDKSEKTCISNGLSLVPCQSWGEI